MDSLRYFESSSAELGAGYYAIAFLSIGGGGLWEVYFSSQRGILGQTGRALEDLVSPELGHVVRRLFAF